MRDQSQSVGVQPSGCSSLAGARRAEVGVQASACPPVAQLPTARNFLGKPLARTDGYLDPYPQTLEKHRYLTCKDSDAYSDFALQESRNAPRAVPISPVRATFWAIKNFPAMQRLTETFLRISNPMETRLSQKLVMTRFDASS